MWTRCLDGFSVMWVTKLISPVKKRIVCPKTSKFGLNWHFWSIRARPCRLIRCPVVGRLVVVARWLYLVRHLFTLWNIIKIFHLFAITFPQLHFCCYAPFVKWNWVICRRQVGFLFAFPATRACSAIHNYSPSHSIKEKGGFLQSLYISIKRLYLQLKLSFHIPHCSSLSSSP